MESKIIDSTVVMGAVASAVLASIPALNDWLQMIVLILTIVFLGLGIAMRAIKIRKSADEEEGD